MLVPYPEGRAPSQRYRFEQWRPLLAADGIDLDLLPFASNALMDVLHRHGRRGAKVTGSLQAFVRRARLRPALRAYDLLVVHRAAFIAGPAALERWLTADGPPLVFDFDDAIYRLHTSDANRYAGWLKFPGKTAELCRVSREITVGNNHLADYARRFNPRVTVIPSSIDTDAYRPVARPPNPRLVIGWTGSSTSQQHLEQFAPVLRTVLGEVDAELHVHSDRSPELEGIPFVWRPWHPDTEVDELSRFDIGIMPMPEDEFARGKGAMKALLYMSMGVPTVCSPITASEELVRHGENGFIARTAADWLGSLRLLRDAGLRARVGAAGRATVERSFSARRSAALFAAVARRAVAR